MLVIRDLDSEGLSWFFTRRGHVYVYVSGLNPLLVYLFSFKRELPRDTGSVLRVDDERVREQFMIKLDAKTKGRHQPAPKENSIKRSCILPLETLRSTTLSQLWLWQLLPIDHSTALCGFDEGGGISSKKHREAEAKEKEEAEKPNNNSNGFGGDESGFTVDTSNNNEFGGQDTFGNAPTTSGNDGWGLSGGFDNFNTSSYEEAQ
ncbi:hypothetical protein N0V83_006486 [Neocucurbitaria cava]|uniref:Uncharacterized protein n=1 Tax=Neocucurbitaria cava TaxID=798079 RepID=A0A9W9CL19_9PLEO|nr:hypothetical protein N0V83_006486 [Neocucurbitaria cava]